MHPFPITAISLKTQPLHCSLSCNVFTNIVGLWSRFSSYFLRNAMGTQGASAVCPSGDVLWCVKHNFPFLVTFRWRHFVSGALKPLFAFESNFFVFFFSSIIDHFLIAVRFSWMNGPCTVIQFECLFLKKNKKSPGVSVLRKSRSRLVIAWFIGAREKGNTLIDIGNCWASGTHSHPFLETYTACCIPSHNCNLCDSEKATRQIKTRTILRLWLFGVKYCRGARLRK